MWYSDFPRPILTFQQEILFDKFQCLYHAPLNQTPPMFFERLSSVFLVPVHYVLSSLVQSANSKMKGSRKNVRPVSRLD